MIECIFIGDELLDGRILNRNQQTISAMLSNEGFLVTQATTLLDQKDQLEDFFISAQKRSNIVITTGGLGPTEDDRTTECIAHAFNLDLIKDDAIYDKLKDYYESRNRPFYKSNIKQAYFPEGAIILNNTEGTAPGFALHHEDTWFFVLPGVPVEMETLLKKDVLPMLNTHCAEHKRFKETALFKCYGIGESECADRFAALYPLPDQIEITFQVKFPEVHIRLNSYDKKNSSTFSMLEKQMTDLLGPSCFTQDIETTYLDYIFNHLKKNKLIAAFAESCTGGLTSSLLTSLPGASDIFDFSVISYSNASKSNLLDVPVDFINKYGAVSAEVAEFMAESCLKKSKANICVSITGIAGPSGGSGVKPVGTVYFGLATNTNIVSFKEFYPTSRTRFQHLAAYKALSLLLN
ncbi:MAG: hypothetical protein CMP39_00860 [Rickettsiales bacterium]|nr:hypothetical protein [Rickettsiales bacterium]|tara:strand:+ start:229 stop:1449 length:1221 start_codon:yes stop_codon:yes gene_type:complete